METAIMERRVFLRNAGLAVGGFTVAGQHTAASAQSSLANKQAKRPSVIWDNREDEIYHEVIQIADPATAADPWYYVFYNQSWTYNRSMTWRRAVGTIIAYEAAGDLALTGSNQQSAWFTGPANTLSNAGSSTQFNKKSSDRTIDCAVLPALTFHVGQHPIFELVVTNATADWQFCIGLKGRAGPPLIYSGWQTGPKTLRFDVAALLRRLGYDKNYAEMHFVIGTWNSDPAGPAVLNFSLRGLAQPAVVACLPVIRTVQTARAGVTISALLIGADGRPATGQATVSLAGRSWPMRLQDGVLQARLTGLPAGDHPVVITANGFAPSTQYVRITDGQFCSWDKKKQYARRPGKPLEPLSGSYEGVFLAKNIGQKSEQLIKGQEDFDNWDRDGGAAERAHSWESMTPAELDEYFAFLALNGWDLVHLHQYWGIWERLDAFGNLAPHGAEQLALYMRTAARYGLHHIQALSSYSYSTRTGDAAKDWWGTVPWKQTLEAGFRDEEWYTPQPGAFQTAFHNYLMDFVTLFSEETALFAMSASGEGDHTNKLPRSNDIFHFVRKIDQNHIFYAEAIHVPKKHLYDKEVEGWTQDFRGARTYDYGQQFDSELDLGIFFKFLKMADDVVMSEGAWPATRLYTQFLSGKGKPIGKQHTISKSAWLGTNIYRTHIRDSIYLGLTNLCPIMMTWDEKLTEDEHKIFHEVRKIINWDQAFQRPQVAMLAYDDNVANGKRGIYGDYERAFRRLGLNYRIVSERMKPFTDFAVYDSKAVFEIPAFASDGGKIPDALRSTIPVTSSDSYFASYCWSQDRSTLVAYFYNISHHEELEVEISPLYHRVPKAALFSTKLTFAPSSGQIRIYDLNDKKTIHQGPSQSFNGFSVPETAHDYLLVITP